MISANSEQLGQLADQARKRLSLTLEELRMRMPPGQVIDNIFGYAREAAGAEFLSNLKR